MARKVHSTRLGSIYVKPQWAENIDRIAEEQGVTMSHVVREALAEYFKKRKLPT